MMWELKCKQNPELSPDDFVHEIEILDAPKPTSPARTVPSHAENMSNPLGGLGGGGGKSSINPLGANPLAGNPLLDGLMNRKYDVGDYVEAKYLDGQWYDARVRAVNDDGSYELAWEDGAPYDTTKRPWEMRKKAEPPRGYAGKTPEPAPVVETTVPDDPDSDEPDAAEDVEDNEKVTDRPDLEPATPLSEKRKPSSPENARMYYVRQGSVLEGWVWKRSRFLKNWRRRWLVLTRDGLESLKQRSANVRATETIQLRDFRRVYNADGEVSMARCFCVVGSRNFYLVSDDEQQKAEWLRQINNVLGYRR
jgi:hypothetical protein